MKKKKKALWWNRRTLSSRFSQHMVADNLPWSVWHMERGGGDKFCFMAWRKKKNPPYPSWNLFHIYLFYISPWFTRTRPEQKQELRAGGPFKIRSCVIQSHIAGIVKNREGNKWLKKEKKRGMETCMREPLIQKHTHTHRFWGGVFWSVVT